MQCPLYPIETLCMQLADANNNSPPGLETDNVILAASQQGCG